MVHCIDAKYISIPDEINLRTVNDATRYAQLLQERRKTAMTHTQSLVPGGGFGEKCSEW